MNFLIFSLIYPSAIYSSILKNKLSNDTKLKSKLTPEDMFMLENMDNSMKIFIYTVNQIDKQNFKYKDLNESVPIFDYKLLINHNQFVDVLYSLNLIELSDNHLLNGLLQDFFEILAFTLVKNNGYKYLNLSKLDLSDYNEVLKKLCIESFKFTNKNVTFIFLLDQVRVFNDRIARNFTKFSVMDISFFQKINQTGHNDIMFWFFEALNLSEVYYFDKYEICVILLNSLDTKTKKRNKFRLSRTLDQINLLYKPVILKIINVLRNDDDLCIFSGMDTVEFLELKNDEFAKILISDFRLNKLKTLKISKIKISMENFLRLSQSWMLECLHISYIHIFQKLPKKDSDINDINSNNSKDSGINGINSNNSKDSGINGINSNNSKDSDINDINSNNSKDSGIDGINSNNLKGLDINSDIKANLNFFNLKDLDIFCCLINKDFINWWKNLENLEILRIKDIVSNECLKYSRKVSTIDKFVPKDHFCFSIDQINSILSTKNLYHLFISGLKLRPSNIQYIQNIKSLRYIFLFNCDIESDQVEGFNDLPDLELLNIRENNKIKKEDIDKLKTSNDGRFEIIY